MLPHEDPSRNSFSSLYSLYLANGAPSTSNHPGPRSPLAPRVHLKSTPVVSSKFASTAGTTHQPGVIAMGGPGIPSIGDIMMLSQAAWRAGRAFVSGRDMAPPEFSAVEVELNRLAKALKMLAESLFADTVDDLLAEAEAGTREGVALIILGCKRTLEDLESLIEQYQVVKRTRTSTGFTVERDWSELVVKRYSNLIWTSEGGSIQILGDMLHMHTATISLVRRLIESKDTEWLDMTIPPVAEKIEEMYTCETHRLADLIAEIRGMTHAHAGSGMQSPVTSPLLASPLPRSNSATEGLAALSLGRPALDDGNSISGPGSISPATTNPHTPEIVGMEYLRTNPREPKVAIMSSGSSKRSSLAGAPHKSLDVFFKTNPPNIYSPRVKSGVPSSGSSGSSRHSFALPSPGKSPSSSMGHRRSTSDTSTIRLPPESDIGEDMVIKGPSEMPGTAEKFNPAASQEIPNWPLGTKCTLSQHDAFERMIFKNCAILCDIRCKIIEYIPHVDPNDDPYEVQLEEAMKNCRVLIVRERENVKRGNIEYHTNIWAFSDDRSVRMQQKINEEIVPFASFFQNEKVSIPVSSSIAFHDVIYGCQPLKEVNTLWLNYIFETSEGSKVFQSQLFGRNLIGSYKTEKTLKVHEGLASVVAYAEQICAMEILRLWEDEDSAGVLALIHFSAQFRKGYLRFYLNNALYPVKVKDEGGKFVKIKGLRIPPDPNQPQNARDARRGSDGKKWISAIKIEFSTDAEKSDFLAKARDAQLRMVDIQES